MKMKKLLLLALIIRTFSADTAHAAGWAETTKTVVDIGGPVIAALSGVAMVVFQYKTHYQAQETHAMSVENHNIEKTAKTQNRNAAKISAYKESHMMLTEAAKRKKSDKRIESELKASELNMCNVRAFLSLGLYDTEDYDPTKTYEAKDLEKIKTDEKKSIDIKKADTSKQPGFFKRTATAMMVPVTLAQAVANRAADILPVNSLLSRIAEHESLKGGFFDTHKRDIGGALVTATIAALSYKAYSWYYNEARITAGENIIELEEQAKLIAAQYKQEMKRTDLSAEDKAKLKKACIQYMKQLKENIRQQKILAGHNVYRNLLIGGVIAAVGLPVLIKYYPNELKNIFFPTPAPQETEPKVNDTPTVTPVVTPQSNADTTTVVLSENQTPAQNTDNQSTPTEESTPPTAAAEATTTKPLHCEWDLIYQDLERLKQKTIAWWNKPREVVETPAPSSEDNNNKDSQTTEN